MTTVRMPVLTYHSIETAATPIAVSPERFAATMRAMKEAGWRTGTDADVRQGQTTGAWPERTFVLHFDDGFASVETQALPVLEQCGFTATIFVVADWVGRSNDWPGQPPDVPRWPLLDWPALRRLRDAGMRMAAHTCTHPWLPALDDDDRRAELRGSVARLTQELGVVTDVMAYPYGASDEATRRAAAAIVTTAYGTTLDFVHPRSEPLDLPRIDGWYLSPQRAATLDEWPVRGWLAGRRILRDVRRRWRSPDRQAGPT